MRSRGVYHHLTINSSNVVTLGGAITVNGDLTVAAGTLSDGGYQITGATDGAGTLTVGSGATLKLGADAATTFPTNFASVILTGGTVEYASNDPDQIVEAGLTYHNLTLSGVSKTAVGDLTVNNTLSINAPFNDGGYTITVKGPVSNSMYHSSTGSGKLLLTGSSGPRTIATTGAYGNLEIDDANGVTAGAGFNINGKLTVTSGTFTLGAFPYQVSGATSVSGTLAICSATGAKVFGAVTINGPGTWSNSSANCPVTILGNFTNNVTTGDFNSGTGTYTFGSGTIGRSAATPITNVTIGGPVTNEGNLTCGTLTVNASLTNNATLTATASLTGPGTLVNSATGVLYLTGTTTFTTLTATAAGNTVVYNSTSGAQTIKGTT